MSKAKLFFLLVDISAAGTNEQGRGFIKWRDGATEYVLPAVAAVVADAMKMGAASVTITDTEAGE